MTDDNVIDAPAGDDELKSIPSMVPEREDIADRRGRRSFMSRDAKPSTAGKPLANNPDTAHQILAHRLLAPGLLAMSLTIALAGIVYLYKQLQVTQQNLAAATSRVEQLEARLVSTDTTLTKSEVLLGAKLKSMDASIDNNKTEIHKLWSASEKSVHVQQVQGDDLQQQKTQLQNVTVQAQQTADQAAKDSALLKNVDNTVKEAAQRMELVQENLNDLSADTKQLKDKQSHLENDMGKRVTALEDTSKSTDVFRRNTLDELRKLREELTKQQTQPATGTKPAP